MENEELKTRIEGIEESNQQIIITLVQDHKETASLLQDLSKKHIRKAFGRRKWPKFL